MSWSLESIDYKDQLEFPWPPGYLEFILPIIDDPTDFTTRLVYADWLDERGDAELAKRVRERAYYQQSMGETENCPRCRGLGVLDWEVSVPLSANDFADIPVERRRRFVRTPYKCTECGGKKVRKKVYPLEWVLGDEHA